MIEVFETAKDAKGRARVGIIIGAGGDMTVAQARALAAKARAHGITLYTLGVGSIAGNRMLVPPEWRDRFIPTKSGFIEKNGSPVVVRVNEAALRALAEDTGGTFGFAEKGQGVDAIMAEIAGLEKDKQVGQVSVEQTLAHGFSFFGFLLLGLSAWIGARKPGSAVVRWSRAALGGAARAVRALRRRKAGPEILSRKSEGRDKATLFSIAPLAAAGAISGLGPVWHAGLMIVVVVAAAAYFMIPARADKAPVDAYGPASSEVRRRYERIKLAAKEIREAVRLGGEFKSVLLARSGQERADSVPSQGEPFQLYDHRTSARLDRDYYKRKEQEPDLDMVLVLNRRRSSDTARRTRASETSRPT
jgi:hypothetical protein